MNNTDPVRSDTLETTSAAAGNRFSLIALTSLFFFWGFITALNDILIPHLRNIFSLSYAQAMLIQFCFFGAYFLMSIPSAKLVTRYGYKAGILIGLTAAGIGCLLFQPAAGMQSYGFFLAALFVLASGITLLQVAANPYVTVLGPPETASSRLTATQAFNSLGTTIAPFFGAVLILSAVVATAPEIASMTSTELTDFRDAEASAIKLPYFILALSFLGLAAVFSALKLPQVHSSTDDSLNTDGTLSSAWQYRHLVLGAGAIFVYVGAEVSIGSFLVNFLSQENIGGMTESTAAKYLSIYWGGAMVGRFIGAALMQRIRGNILLLCNGAFASLLVAITIFSTGALAMWAILLVGLCNSIMFPVIFSLALQKLGRHTSQGSGILCLAIVGGAIVPVLQGFLADAWGLQIVFVLPLICYFYIVFYGARGYKPVY
jgi:FHS family L-fucose permease-like MFS transporter